jgi:hypothetical protein
LHQFVEIIVPLLAKAIEDQFYKTAGEAILTTQSVLYVLNNQKSQIDVNKYVNVLYASIIMKLRITDIDQVYLIETLKKINISKLFRRLRKKQSQQPACSCHSSLLNSGIKL